MDRCLICTDTTAIALDADALTETAIRVCPLGLRLSWYDLAIAAMGAVVTAGVLIHHVVR